MFCYHCGKEVADGSAFCPYCGTAIAANSPAPSYQQPYFASQGAPQKDVNTTETLGIVSLVGSFFMPIVGFICGIIGLSKIKKLKPAANDEQQQKLGKHKKLCSAGVIISSVLTVLSLLIGIVWGVYIAREISNDFRRNQNRFDNYFGDDFDGYEDYQDQMDDFFNQYGIEFDG